MVIQSAQGFDLAVEPGKTFMDYINEFGRFGSLKKTADMEGARKFSAQREGNPVTIFKASIMLRKLLGEFGFPADSTLISAA